MAGHETTYEFGTATGTDLADHRQTYDGFLKLVKYSAAGIVLVLVLMAVFLL